MTIPVASSAGSFATGLARILDNGAASNTPGRWDVGNSVSTITIWGTATSTNWTASAGSNFAAVITYPI